jgi:hypothetical protein
MASPRSIRLGLLAITATNAAGTAKGEDVTFKTP